jgi:class 3 adenylate cyclase/DNA-binding winged helix-turn-helix (wHTH) protein/predicted ATPase
MCNGHQEQHLEKRPVMRYAFADCVLDTDTYALHRADRLLRLRPKVFQVLMYLLLHRERVVAKHELAEQVWPAQYITDAVVENTLKVVRQAVGDSGHTQQVIQTLRGYGYRFVAPVAVYAETPADAEGPREVAGRERPETGHSQASRAIAESLSLMPIGEAWLCPACHVSNAEAARSCIACGTFFQSCCPRCSSYNVLHTQFCTACGAPLVEPTPTADPPVGDDLVRVAQGQFEATQAPIVRRDIPGVERRQLTVLFCDLVESTPLLEHLELEDLRTILRAFQDMCADVTQQFDGYIAQYLSDGVLGYFGYPLAHEDDALRAVHTGLGILEALEALNHRLAREQDVRLAARVGIHTGLVIIGAAGTEGRPEALAFGDTLNIAERIQSIAAPNTVVISAATARLIQGYFACQALGSPTLRGVTTAVPLSRVLRATGAQSRLEIAHPTGLTPLVGREAEVSLLLERWAQVTEGIGHVVLLSGEAGIGKSRLVQAMKEHVPQTVSRSLECRCSPYFQQSALYPLIEMIQRLLAWHPDDGPDAKLQKLEAVLSQYARPVEQLIPLFVDLLSLPTVHDRYRMPQLIPPQQRHKTLEAVLGLLVGLAMQQPVLLIIEDLHWVDPSTLEWLTLFLDQIPTTPILLVLTYRPAFQVPWANRSSLTQITLPRLSRQHVEQMVMHLTGGKPLPGEVLRSLVPRTDGMPLFVEELTKTVLETNLLCETHDHYELSGPLPAFAIPTTLHDSLMARLDRLGTAKSIAQLGATMGRRFTYALLQAVLRWEDGALQHELAKLVKAELLHQQGLPPQTTYVFKHALIQETAYQALVRNTRQDYHQRIAQVLVEQFPETVEAQPELLAHHYTEAGWYELAINYWQRAGQHAVERSANAEAISHCTKGLELLKTLPATAARIEPELILQATLGSALIARNGYASSDVEHTYSRARALCQQVGETSQLFRVTRGLCLFYMNRGELHIARETGGQLLSLAQYLQDPICLVEAYRLLGAILHWLGELTMAREHLEQGIAFYDSQQHRSYVSLYGQDPGVTCFSYLAWTLWCLGYSAQALESTNDALALSRKHLHDFSLAFALDYAAVLHHCRREGQVAQERAEKMVGLSQEHGFSFWLSEGMILQGYGLVKQGQKAEGIAQMCQGLAAHRATGTELARPSFLALLAEGYGDDGQVEEALSVLDEALIAVQNTGECWWEAELYRLRGELGSLQAVDTENPGTAPIKTAMRIETNGGSTARSSLTPNVEACFHKALTIARRQHAKSLELRAAISLARLWQRQAKRAEARHLLVEVYSWFTEGFDTADLQEANALLAELACS